MPTVRQTTGTASLDFRTALPWQLAMGYTALLKCMDVLRAQRACGRELIPEVWLSRGFLFCFVCFLTGRENRNCGVSQVRSLGLWPAKLP